MKRWFAVIHIVILLASPMRAEAAKLPIAKPGCTDHCGDVTISFPWGLGSNCSLDEWHEMECRETNASHHSTTTKLPFLTKLNVEVMKIELVRKNLDPRVIIRMPPMKECSTTLADTRLNILDLRGGPYTISSQDNVFVLEGCPGRAALVDEKYTGSTTSVGCATICLSNITSVKSNNCHGDKCCQSPLQDDFQLYQVHLYRRFIGNHKLDNNCLLATLVMSDHLDQYVKKLSSSVPYGAAPVALNWRWISKIQRPHVDMQTTTCDFNVSGLSNWVCSCNENHRGNNPYVYGGCQVPQNCKACPGSCVEEDVFSNIYKCRTKNHNFFTSDAALQVYRVLGIASIAIGPLLLVFAFRKLYHCIKRGRKAEKRVKFFKLMLHRHKSSNNGAAEITKLFTNKELDKATENFNDNRVLGKGGQGTVYKGMLTDGRIVAVKKSVQMDESQMEQFINEVVILSQTNHRNVVKLMGCCLETEVPLLAYEYISNGTLHQHIHNPGEDGSLTWAMRLKIAVDSAGAIAYLHSSSCTPIYHRDIKTANILLDDKYRAKVSDFGISKTLEIDQTHLTTLVQGTFGYLDPEYFESSVFTEKSDVYSFGVVLLELLTSKKPIFRDEERERKGLASEFLIHMQNQSLSNILDPEVVKEAKEEEIVAYADLAKRCLNYSGRLRPTMREVAMALERIIKPPTQIDAQFEGSLKDEGFDEIVMSDEELRSSSVRVGVVSSFYIDEAPLLHDTI